MNNNRIKVGAIGIGNCFSGLIQGIELYRTILKDKEPTGLMNEKIGSYSIFDIDFVAGWDVGENKIIRSIISSIYQEPNLVNWIDPKSSLNKRSDWWKECLENSVVQEAPILDGIGIYVENKIKPISNPKSLYELEKEVIQEIKNKRVEILVNYLPVGSQKATEWWAEIALKTGCAFINCIPQFIASVPTWESRFKDKRIPIIGDDVKGQIGATIVHRILAWLVNNRGAKLERTYQLNVGGNTDFLNMKEQERLESKKISKTTSVQSQLSKELNSEHIYIGPSDFIPFLGNTKLAFIRLEGKMFAEIPFNMELRLEVDDKSNSAGVVIDAIRCAKLALDRKIGGNLEGPSAYFCKHPLEQFSDDEAKKMTDKFIV